MKTTYNLAVSIDGYIAKPDGDISWLDELKVDHENTGHEAFYETVDALVMGFATYNFVHDYGSWPYGNKPTWVCTHSKLDVMDGCNLQEGSEPEFVHDCANKSGIEHLWLVGGGVLATSFVNSGLLTHIGLSVMPIILGSGIKVFDVLPAHVLLQQTNSTALSGLTHIEYSLDI